MTADAILLAETITHDENIFRNKLTATRYTQRNTDVVRWHTADPVHVL